MEYFENLLKKANTKPEKLNALLNGYVSLTDLNRAVSSSTSAALFDKNYLPLSEYVNLTDNEANELMKSAKFYVSQLPKFETMGTNKSMSIKTSEDRELILMRVTDNAFFASTVDESVLGIALQNSKEVTRYLKEIL